MKATLTKMAAAMAKATKGMSDEDKAAAAAGAFVLAYMGMADAARELAAHEGNAWSHYVEAVAYGTKPDTLRDSLKAHLGEDEDERKRASDYCKNYKRRVEALLGAGVALVGPDGLMVESASCRINGETVEGSLTKLSKALLDAASKKRGTKGGGKGKDKDEDGDEDTLPEVTDANVPITRVLLERVAVALNSPDSGVLRAALVEGCPDVILTMAAAITARREESKGILKAQATKREEARQEAQSRVKAAAEELAKEAREEAARRSQEVETLKGRRGAVTGKAKGEMADTAIAAAIKRAIAAKGKATKATRKAAATV